MPRGKHPVVLRAFASTSIGGILVHQAAAERERFGNPAQPLGSSESVDYRHAGSREASQCQSSLSARG